MGVQQIQYIDKVVDIPESVDDDSDVIEGVNTNTSELSWFMDESTAVILKEKSALKSLDVVNEKQCKTDKERRDTGGLTANNDHTVTEYHTVVLKASADHTLLLVAKYLTWEAREHLPRANGHAVQQYYVVVLEVPEEASAEW